MHIDLDQQLQPHHRVLAGLVSQLAPAGSVVLDIGCGTGHTLASIRSDRPDLILHGVDGSPDCVAITKQRVPSAEILQSPIETFLDSAQQHDFDIVVLSHVLEHLGNVRHAAERIRELMNGNGILLLALPNSTTPPMILRSILRRSRANGGHYYCWDRGHFSALLSNLDDLFLATSVHGDAVPLTPARMWTRSRRLQMVNEKAARLLPELTTSHIAVLEAR